MSASSRRLLPVAVQSEVAHCNELTPHINGAVVGGGGLGLGGADGLMMLARERRPDEAITRELGRLPKPSTLCALHVKLLSIGGGGGGELGVGGGGGLGLGDGGGLGPGG